MNRAILFSLLLTSPVLADSLRGVVVDFRGAAVAGANVSAGGRSTTTTETGSFGFEVAPGTYDLRVTHAAHETEVVRAVTGNPVEVLLTSAFSEVIEVSAIRAGDQTPVTKTDITRDEIGRDYHGQDVPLLLRRAPSIQAWAESGAGGAGYSYITLRGISATRINFTLDGVPLADSEDMGTYFVDFPDLARSLESIQIQRGAGTSTFGSASFGGSVNLESISIAAEERVEATIGGGSFGNRQATIAYHSGAAIDGLAFYTRVSYLESDGYRENSSTRQANLFFSGERRIGEGQLRLTGFSGQEEQQLSFYAADQTTLKENPRANPLLPGEKDRFDYDLAQFQYLMPVGEASSMTASLYYQRGYGWYRLLPAEYGLDGTLLGSIVTFSRTSGALTTNFGLHLNRFKRDHTRNDIASGRREYANHGVKGEANAFAKASYDAGRWHFYGDAQLRHASFDYVGSVEIPGVSWTFFNPKIGARFALSASSSIYGSVGVTTREPGRTDMFHGADNPAIPYDLDAVKPERVIDFEAGWHRRSSSLDLAVNFFAMEFHDEIAATGELSEAGLPLRRNVDRSTRRGIEVDAAWQVTQAWLSTTTATVSRNRIAQWMQFYDVYDAEGSWIGSRSLTHRGVEPLLTPSILVTQAIRWTPSTRFSAGVIARYAGRSFLDNTGDTAFSVPAHATVDASASLALSDSLRLSLNVGNVFDGEQHWTSGYSYRYFVEQQRSGTAYFFPQATRSAVILLDFKL